MKSGLLGWLFGGKDQKAAHVPPTSDETRARVDSAGPKASLRERWIVRGKISKYERRMHIALTRATAGVVVVCAEAAVEEDSRLAALASPARTGKF